MKFFLSLLIAFSPVTFIFSQDSIISRIVLIGDGGELKNGRHPVAEAVKKIIPFDARTTIIYLGDNLYHHGLPDEQSPGYEKAKIVLDSQLLIADNTPAKIYMIPGNHDWINGSRYGYDAIIREQAYVDGLNRDNVKFYPENGCPGPVEVSLGPTAIAVFFDSQWWLHSYDKPGIESDCDYKTKDEVLAQLEDIFSKNANKLIILACHHTFKSSGAHGGYYTLKQHIFPFTDIIHSLYLPLPVIGSIYPIVRSVFGTPQDLKHPNYANMISEIQRIARPYHNIIFAAGHEHSLQLIRDSSFNYIVSGAGSKATRVSSSKKNLYAESNIGFSVLEVSRNKNVRITFYTVTDSIRTRYSDVILNYSSSQPITDEPVNRNMNMVGLGMKDSISFTASDRYIAHSFLRKFFMGNNYRWEWATPVTMKVLDLRNEKGGLTPSALSGGKQTQSLTLTDMKGKEWILRPIDKNPSRVITENLHMRISRNLLKDFVSAAHPYAPMAIHDLASALELKSPEPQLFFVPDDPVFGIYQATFAKTICLLEEKAPVENDVKTRSTNKVFNNLLEKNDRHIDQPAVLRARLLDILIADFDRHFGQWRWIENDTGKGKFYSPIPRDRDQAFFYSNGFLMKLLTAKVLPFRKGFRSTIPDVKWLGESARDFDRIFLTGLDAGAWEKEIKTVQEKLTDDVISGSIHRLPPEIYAVGGHAITNKLISRRKLLEKAGMDYYRYISKKVNIAGSNQDEYFSITGTPEGLNVKVFGRENGNNKAFLVYDRTFDRRVTKELRLYGLAGNDIFDIDESANSKIKVRLIGGKGNDSFDIRGHVRNYLYDMNVNGNNILHASSSKNMFSSTPEVNYNSLLGFKYNTTRFPAFSFAVNNEDGLFGGISFFRKTYGFRNEPYATYQQFVTLHAFDRGGHSFRYSGEFSHAIRKKDLVLQSEVMAPGLSNYFGLGNNTAKVSNRPSGFYQTRYGHMETAFMIQKRTFEKLRVMAGPAVYMYWNDYTNNRNKILGTYPSVLGLDSASVYSNKTYIGAKLGIQINNLNDEIFPTRGIKWNTEFVSMAPISKAGNSYTKLMSEMTVFASMNDPTHLIAVIRLGAGRIYSKNFEYFQALSLGENNYLRGFRKNRFAGRSVAYGGLEFRLKLFDINSYLLPGSFGLIGFGEAGRVWLKGETSHILHTDYGFGFYFIPFNMFIISGTMAYSKEEHLPSFSLGGKINLGF